MSLSLLALVIACAFILTKLGWLKDSPIKWLSHWIIHIAMPAVALVNIPHLQMGHELMPLLLAPMLVFFGAFAIAFGLLRNHLSNTERTAVAVVAGLGNTSFLGYPILSSLYGAQILGYAMVFDQVAFVLFVGIAYTLVTGHGQALRWRQAVVRILQFPAFLALIFALIVPPFWLRPGVADILELIAASLSPCAVIVVGHYIARYLDMRLSMPVIYGVAYTLIIAPLLVSIMLLFMPTMPVEIHTTTLMEAAMPPMITIVIIAVRYQLEPKISAQILGWGAIGSVVTLPIWFFINEAWLAS